MAAPAPATPHPLSTCTRISPTAPFPPTGARTRIPGLARSPGAAPFLIPLPPTCGRDAGLFLPRLWAVHDHPALRHTARSVAGAGTPRPNPPHWGTTARRRAEPRSATARTAAATSARSSAISAGLRRAERDCAGAVIAS